MINLAEAKRLEELYEDLLREHNVAIENLRVSIDQRNTDLNKPISIKISDTETVRRIPATIRKMLADFQADDTKQAEFLTDLQQKSQQLEKANKNLDEIEDKLAALPETDANRATRDRLHAKRTTALENQNKARTAFEKTETDLNKLKAEAPDRKARKTAYEKALADPAVQTLEATKDKEEKQKNLLESLKIELGKEKAEFAKLTEASKLVEIQKATKEKLEDLENENLKKKVNDFFDQQKLHNELNAFAHIQNRVREDAQAKNHAQLTFVAGTPPPSNKAEFDRFIKNLQRDHFFYDAKGRALVEYVSGGDSPMGQSKPALVLTDDPRSPEVTAYTARALGWTSATIEKGTHEERDQLARYALQNEFEHINFRVTDATGRPSFSGTDLIWSNIFKARDNLPAREGVDKQIFSKEAKSENTRLYSQLKTDYRADADQLRAYMLSALTGEQLAKMAYDLRNAEDPIRIEFYQFLSQLFVTKKHSDLVTFFEQTKEFINQDNSANELKSLLLAQHTPSELAKIFLDLDVNKQRDLYAVLSQQQRVATFAELTLPQLIAAVTTLNNQISPEDLSKVLANKEAGFVSDFWDNTKTSTIYNAESALKKTVWAKFSLEKLVNIARSITNDAEFIAFYKTLNKETRKQILEQFDANILVKMAPAILSDAEIVREPKVRMLARFDANHLINAAAEIHDAPQPHPDFYSMLEDAFFVKKQSIKDDRDAANFNVAVEEFLNYTAERNYINYNNPQGEQLAIKSLAMLPSEHLKQIFAHDTSRATQYYPLLNIEHRKELLNKLAPATLVAIANKVINDSELGRDTKVSLLYKLSPQQLADVAGEVSGNTRAEFYKLLADVFFNKKDNTGAVDFDAVVTFLNQTATLGETQHEATMITRLLEQTLKANSNLPSWIKKQTLPEGCEPIFKNSGSAFDLLPDKLKQFAIEKNWQPEGYSAAPSA